MGTICFALAFAAGLAFACADANVADGTASLAIGCTKDLDCPDTFSCVNQACRIDPAPCDANVDCLADDVCTDDGECVLSCLLRACDTGYTCDAASRQCVAEPSDAGTDPGTPECTTDADCDNGRACRDGECSCTADGWDDWAHEQFTSSCVHCHGWMDSYPQVFTHQRAIRDAISSGNQPPAGAVLPEKTRLMKWLVCGAPQ